MPVPRVRTNNAVCVYASAPGIRARETLSSRVVPAALGRRISASDPLPRDPQHYIRAHAHKPRYSADPNYFDVNYSGVFTNTGERNQDVLRSLIDLPSRWLI